MSVSRLERLERFAPPYAFFHFILRQAFRRGYRMWVEGAENVPVQGGCLIASNHISLLDPPVLGTALPHRQVYFMAKKELFRIPVLSTLLTWFGTFPVERGVGDRKAMEQAVRLLQQGRVVGIYPEGTRSVDGRLREGRAGVAMLASRAGVPVVPAAVFGTDEAFHRRRMLPGGPPFGIRFGPPLHLEPEPEANRARLQEIRAMIMGALAEQVALGEPEWVRR